MKKDLTRSEIARIGYFASLNTRRNNMQKRIEEYNLNPTKCHFCGKELDYNHRHNKFCSCSCASKENNTKINRLKRKIKYCKSCGKEINNRNTYCSQECQMNFQWKIKKEKILSNGFFDNGLNCEASRKIVKKFLLEREGHKCQICGYTEWMGQPIPLVVDHIDGNSENSAIDNFRLICGNCHMQTSTFAGRNRNNGRIIRKRRRQSNDL